MTLRYLIPLGLSVAYAWYALGYYAYGCMYGWAYWLWNEQNGGVTSPYWHNGGRKKVMRKWRVWAYVGGPIAFLTCVLWPDPHEKFRKPGS